MKKYVLAVILGCLYSEFLVANESPRLVINSPLFSGGECNVLMTKGAKRHQCLREAISNFPLDYQGDIYAGDIFIEPVLSSELYRGYNLVEFCAKISYCKEYFVLTANGSINFKINKESSYRFDLLVSEDKLKTYELVMSNLNKFFAKYPANRADEIDQWLRNTDYKKIHRNKSEVQSYIDDASLWFDSNIPYYTNLVCLSLLSDVFHDSIRDLASVINSDIAEVELMIERNQVDKTMASKILHAMRNEKNYLEAVVEGHKQGFIKAGKELESAVEMRRSLHGFQDVVYESEKMANLIYFSERIKSKGWVNGLSVLGKTEYFSREYIGYLFRVDEYDDYVVVQSSGRIARLESRSGSPTIIVDFQNSPPPREGVDLTGRYLVLNKVGSYPTPMGVSRNAYFFSIAK